MGHDHSHEHDHSHSHGHDHGHGLGHHHHHHHPLPSHNSAFAIGAGLNLGFVLVEAGCGIAFGSLALLADAGHNLADVAGLLLAWGAIALARRRPTGRLTYGLGRGTILAALGNAGLLLFGLGAIGWEAVRRLLTEATPIEAGPVMAVAAVGLVINGITALMFRKGASSDLNLRGAFLHMAADAAISGGVIVAAGLIALTGWNWIDPVIGLAIVAIIAIGTWGLFRDSLDLALDAVPAGIDRAAVEAFLLDQPGVSELHDLHIWSLSTSAVALTAHLVMPDSENTDSFLLELAEELREHFGIDHSTVQIERSPCDCPLIAVHAAA
jgi:cobalt-zinc-cadmium efflux system protein